MLFYREYMLASSRAMKVVSPRAMFSLAQPPFPFSGRLELLCSQSQTTPVTIPNTIVKNRFISKSIQDFIHTCNEIS